MTPKGIHKTGSFPTPGLVVNPYLSITSKEGCPVASPTYEWYTDVSFVIRYEPCTVARTANIGQLLFAVCHSLFPAHLKLQ